MTQLPAPMAAEIKRLWGERGSAADPSRDLSMPAILFSGLRPADGAEAARALAQELGLELRRIDLSRIVSKYIAETEKALDRIFAAAPDSGEVLLFDEADALFGKRSHIKDSHDRYADIEIGYLLARIEAHHGPVILTTHHKVAIDAAFLGRLRLFEFSQ